MTGRGRPPIGKRAMTDAERQRRRRAKLRDSQPVTKKVSPDHAGVLAELAKAKAKIAELERAANIKPVRAASPARLDRQIDEEVRRRIAAADDAMRAHSKELHLENIGLRRMLGVHGVFTETQYQHMLILCHPDNSASQELKARLLQVLVENKPKLIKGTAGGSGQRKAKRA